MSGVSRLSVREIAIPFLGMLNVFGFDHINGKHHEFKRYNVDEDLSAIEFSENSIGYYNQRLKEEGLCVILLTDLLKRNNFKQALKVIRDRKSTRLNSSHVAISYAVFCLKKKKKNEKTETISTRNTIATEM